ncbi:DUF397 domain-containing protein [Streptomyces mutabilis]
MRSHHSGGGDERAVPRTLQGRTSPRPFSPQRPSPTPQRSYSSGTGGECVEVTVDLPGLVPVRDSKNPHGPALVFPVEAWSAFVGVL